QSSLYCTRHAVMPDNELEVAEGLHVEDIDCTLIVRPTRTALDLTFFGEMSYSFEIVSARLVRPPKRPPDEACLKRCSRMKGKACSCRGRGYGRYNDARFSPAVFAEMDGTAEEGRGGVEKEEELQEEENGEGEGEGGEDGMSRAHHSLHMGVNDVATLVLEDNQGFTYDFYTFQVRLLYSMFM
ncbi:unnamed protein product, partial [Laminaria digitata]